MGAKVGTGNRVIQSGYSQAPTGVSGTTYPWGEASGPWYIETQKMDISYVRVPNYILASEGLGLSSVSTTYNILDTHLLCVVDAYVSRASSTDFYTTSSYQQNQKFLVNNVSSDSYGNNYGTMDASNLGCGGDIYTASTHFKRVQLATIPWVNPAFLGASSFQGTNFVLAGGDNGIPEVDTSSNQAAEMWDMKRSSRANVAGSFLPGPETNMTVGGPQPAQTLDTLNVVDQPVYTMMGPYDPNQETYFHITQAIDQLGTKVATETLATTPPVTGAGNGPYTYNWMGFNAGLAFYDINLHDYT